MRNKSRLFMLAAICLLAIGFAVVATTLTINGNVTVGTNMDDFRVVFTKAKTSDKTSTAEITNDGKNINFFTRELTKLNDEVTLNYEISNFSRNYNVRTTVTLEGIDEGKNEYFYVTKNEEWVTNNSGVIDAGSKTRGSITIKLTKLYIGSTAMEPIEFSLNIVADAISINELADELIPSGEFQGESILAILDENDFFSGEGFYSFVVEEETYNVHMYNYDNDLTISESRTFGSDADVSVDIDGERQYAQNMVVVKVDGDLTIDEDVTVAPYYDEETGYGGPKGFLIYVTGKLTNNGIIDNSHGAYAEGQNVYLLKNPEGSENEYEYVPATGASGAEGYSRYSTGTEFYIQGVDGSNGTGRETGGGGLGSSTLGDSSSKFTIYVRDSTAGTSYSGGTGSGGIDVNIRGGSYAGTAPVANGGAGGLGYGINSSGWTTRYGGGGAGNPGGKGGQGGNGNTSSYKEEDGTGCLLIIYANEFDNQNELIAKGSDGGNGRGVGGSSGGGSINVFYKTLINEGNANVDGGIQVRNFGGAGGTGTITFTQINN